MEHYSFIVKIPYKGTKEFLVEIDAREPLIECFASVVDAMTGTEDEIPIVRKDELGHEMEVIWVFAWGDPEAGIEELAEHLSLKAQGVPPGSEIVVTDISIGVGAPEMSNDARLVNDRVRLMNLIKRNAEHLDLIKATPRTMDISVKGVKAITGLDEDGRIRCAADHRIRILIPERYPYEGPTMVPLSPVFHPNICLNGAECHVCYSEGYTPDGEDTLSYMVDQYVRMIQYHPRAWNLEEPHRRLNLEASRWLEARLAEGSDLIPIKPTVKLRCQEER